MQYYLSVCDYRDWDFRTPRTMRAIVGIKFSVISSLTAVRYHIEVSIHLTLQNAFLFFPSYFSFSFETFESLKMITRFRFCGKL